MQGGDGHKEMRLLRIRRRAVTAFERSSAFFEKLVSGFYRLPTQKELLLAVDWNVLIVLDACRGDFFRKLIPRTRTVRSLGRSTAEWLGRFTALLEHDLGQKDLLWFNANPVVDRDLRKGTALNIRTVKIWKTAWSKHGSLGIPSVHPESVNEAVASHLTRYGQPDRMVVHYLQPHSPYIGRRQLPLSVWSLNPDALSRAAHRLKSPVEAVEDREVTWPDVRRAYVDNLRLVLGAVLRLMKDLRGRIVITADHGELLGEHGRFGHERSWHSQELYCVPWFELHKGSFRPRPIPHIDYGDYADSEETRRKLQALGYI